jgi:hypothetical protein
MSFVGEIGRGPPQPVLRFSRLLKDMECCVSSQVTGVPSLPVAKSAASGVPRPRNRKRKKPRLFMNVAFIYAGNYLARRAHPAGYDE